MDRKINKNIDAIQLLINSYDKNLLSYNEYIPFN